MNRIVFIAGFLIVFFGVGALISQQLGKQAEQTGTALGTSTKQVGPTTALSQITPDESMKAPKMTLKKNKTYTAIMKTTAGDMTIDLYSDKTPITVNNFVYLARKNFYTNVIFHRVIKDFMIQGGDPTGTGSGGPGYTFADEPFTGEYTRGTIAMANAGPNTNGSQFFIMHKDVPLPKNYVIFGKVSQGLDTVDTIAETPVKPGGEGSTPVNPVKILSVQIVEK